MNVTPELQLEILEKIKKKAQRYHEADSESADFKNADELVSEIETVE